MKLFNQNNVVEHGCLPNCGKIYADRSELVRKMLPHQKLGLSLTASGYGAKLPTDLMINFCGRLYRIYSTCYSNAGSCWFMAKGQKIFVD